MRHLLLLPLVVALLGCGDFVERPAAGRESGQEPAIELPGLQREAVTHGAMPPSMSCQLCPEPVFGADGRPAACPADGIRFDQPHALWCVCQYKAARAIVVRVTFSYLGGSGLRRRWTLGRQPAAESGLLAVNLHHPQPGVWAALLEVQNPQGWRPLALRVFRVR